MGYFNDYDFDLFTYELQDKNTKELRDGRKQIQDKLLEIKDDLKSRFLHLNLHPHWKKENITSLLFPCEYNHGRVSWIGLRFGRPKSEIDLLNVGLSSSDPFLGFQKYNCFQVDISIDGLDIGIYHSVPNDAVDRMYVRDNIETTEFQAKLKEVLPKLLGYGYTFSVGKHGAVSNKWETHRFEFDSHYGDDIVEAFTKFYLDNVTDGTHSSLLYHYPRYDKRIEQKEQIESEFINHVDKLLPFYKLMSWKTKIN